MLRATGHIEQAQKILWLSLVIITALFVGTNIVKVSLGYVIAVMAGCTLALFSFLSPELSLYILVASMLLSPEFIVGGLSGGTNYSFRGLTLRYDDVVIVIVGLSWFMKTAVRKELGLFMKTPLNKPIFLFMAVCVVATLFGFMGGRVKPVTGFFYVLKYFEYVVIYFMAVNILKEKKQVERFLWTMFFVGVIACFMGLMELPEDGRVSAPFEGETSEPNTFGGYLVLMSALASGLLLTNDSIRWKPLLVGILALFIVTLALTLSRSSWLAVVPVLLTLQHFSKKRVLMLIVLLSLAVALPFAAPQSVKDRIMYTFKPPEGESEQVRITRNTAVTLDGSTSYRIMSWQTIMERDFQKHPLIGWGVTGYSFIDANYFRILVETGMIGLACFFYLAFVIFRESRKAYHGTSDPLFRGLALGYIAGFVGLLVHAVGTNTFIIVRIMEPFWFLTAMVILIPAMEGQKNAEENGSADSHAEPNTKMFLAR